MTCPRCDIGWPHLHVTEILYRSGLVDTTYFTEAGRETGTHVHTLCDLIDDDDLDDDTLDPALAGYAAAYRRARAEVGMVWTAREQRIADETMGYVGRYDRLGTWHGLPVLVDIKTNEARAWTGIQLAGYARCLPEPRVKRYALELHGSGTYSLVNYTDRSDERIFLAALQVAQWQVAHE